MAAMRECQPGGSEEFFIRGIHAEVSDYLAFLTDYAAKTTRSWLAFLALDTTTVGPSVAYDLNFEPGQAAAPAAQGHAAPAALIKETIRRCMRAGPAAGHHYCLMTSAGPFDRALNDQEVADRLLNSASFAWIRLSDGHCPMGWLGLAAERQGAYPDDCLGPLTRSLLTGMTVVSRLLLREYAKAQGREIHLVGQSAKFLEFERKLKQAALHNRAPVLIRGERGCGKELAAYGVHYFSSRRQGPFVSVLAPAIAESLQSDELFGHEKNAFTGAASPRKGKFLAAQGGTVFLDEVGDLSSALQFTLLRVIEHGEIQPLGRDLPVNVNVRVVTATNKDLDRMVSEGRLRSDLFDRLNVITLAVPPLRERREDIPLLIRYFLRRECLAVRRREQFGQRPACQACDRRETVACASPGFFEAMQEYDWPGNVRELENVITRLATMACGEVLRVRHLPDYMVKNSKAKAAASPDDFSLDTFMKRHINQVLILANYNASRAARMLRIPRSTLRSKMKRLAITPSDF